MSRPEFDLSNSLDVLDADLKARSTDTPQAAQDWKDLKDSLTAEQQALLFRVIRCREDREFVIGARALLQALRGANLTTEGDGGLMARRLSGAETERLHLRVQVMELKQEVAALKGERFVPTPQEKADWDYARVEIRKQKDAVVGPKREAVEVTARAIEAFVSERGGRVDRATVQAALSAYRHFSPALRHLTLSSRATLKKGHIVTTGKRP